MIVVDASVAIKLLRREEVNHKEARALLQKHFSKTDEILVPDLIFYEAANALATKVQIPSFVALRSFTQLKKFDFNIYRPTFEDVDKTTKLAKKYNTTIYDMLYAVVAKKHKTYLITADDNFARKTGLKFVKLLKNVEISSNDKQSLN